MYSGSSSSSSHPVSRKIDAHGRWCYFPGVTAVCHLDEQSRRRFEAVEQAIAGQPTLSRYFAPLPAASLHVTISGVANRDQMALPDWRALVQRRSGGAGEGQWVRAAASVRQLGLAPAVAMGPFFSATASILGFNVAFEWGGGCGGQQQLEELQQILRDGRSRPYTPHCTLGYQFQQVPAADLVAVAAELSTVQECARRAFLDAAAEAAAAPTAAASGSSPRKQLLQLQAAQFCWYSDMTSFIEWKAVEVAPDLLVSDCEVGSPMEATG